VSSKISLVLLGFAVGLPVAAALAQPAISSGPGAVPPITDAGLSRYAAYDPIFLDGTGSYDPDGSGPLSYAWRQIAGPPVVITDADTANPKISGFVQTDAIQECEFELVVSDGELISEPDTVKVVIVPAFGDRLPELKNDSFDPNKPTFIFFGGGDCVTGLLEYARLFFDRAGWLSRVNAIEFPKGYEPDDITSTPTYYQCGDMIIVYLSAVAPNYNQPIQTSGHSTGGMPAIDVGIHLNLTYADPRYAVNRVTFFDVACLGESGYWDLIEQFWDTSVDGEQCWVDNYPSTRSMFSPNALNVVFPGGNHGISREWYNYSLTTEDMNKFNNGVVAGAYWSVAGPGKNLQLASTSGTMTYTFQWNGSMTSGYMDFLDESSYPGRLPEPVNLVAWADALEPNGVVLTCYPSENAVRYQLLFGTEPHRVQDYEIVSDTPTPPTYAITDFPSEETWWTIKAYDQYGSTIYADPIRLDVEALPPLSIENLSTGKRYGLIQHAIYDASPGDEIVARGGIYHENIDFEGKNLTVRSTNPDDPATVAATVINGGHQGSVITMSGSQDEGCILAGLTIIGGTVGISCRDASPTIRNCTIESNGPNAIEFWEGYEPTIIDCIILGQVKELNDPRLVAHWKLDETEGVIAYDSAGNNDASVYGPVWQPTGGKVNGALEFDGIYDFVITPFVLNPAEWPFSVFAWIKVGAPGQVVISQTGGVDWLLVDPSEGKLMTELKGPGRDAAALMSNFVITDGQWHRVGFVWDGANRTLYVDDVEVAADTKTRLTGSGRGLYFGAGSILDIGCFWSGLIDDVRIYNRAVTP